jgi:hypothetical protein
LSPNPPPPPPPRRIPGHIFFSFCKNEAISIKQALLITDLADLFHLPLPEEALPQFHLFQALLLDLEPFENVDCWSIMGKSDSTKVSSVYKSLMNHSQFLNGCGKAVANNTRCFLVLVHNRLNTRAMLQRKNFFMDDYSCIMCGANELETRNHLFFLFPFVHICWRYLCPSWTPPHQTDIQSITDSLKVSLKESFFMEPIYPDYLVYMEYKK